MFDIQEIKDSIQHRHPFLLVDKIIEVEEGQKAVGGDLVYELDILFAFGD